MNFLLSLFFSFQAFTVNPTEKIYCYDLWSEPEYQKWLYSPESNSYPEPLEQLLERCDSTSGRYGAVLESLSNVYSFLRRYKDAINLLESFIGKEGELIKNLRQSYAWLYSDLFSEYAADKNFKTSFYMIKRSEEMWNESPGWGRQFDWDLHSRDDIQRVFAIEKLGLDLDTITKYREEIINKYHIVINEKESFIWKSCNPWPLFYQDGARYRAALEAYDLVQPEVVKEKIFEIFEMKPNLIDTHCELDGYELITKAFSLSGDFSRAINYYEYLENKNQWGPSRSGIMLYLIYRSALWYHSVGEIEKARLQYLRYLVYFSSGSNDYVNEDEVSSYLRLKELEAGTGPFDPEFLLSLVKPDYLPSQTP